MNKVTFEKNENGLKLLAVYVSQLTREGVTFEILDDINFVTVILTGGF